MAQIKGFTFFASYWDAIKMLNKKDQNEMLIAIMEYVFENKKTQFSKKNELIWTLVRPTLDKSKNRSHENSGAPKGNQNARKYGGKTEFVEDEKKQSKNNQKIIKKQSITSLSLSLSYSLSYSNNKYINNNKNIKELFTNYILFRINNNYNTDEVVISELLNKLDLVDTDEEREQMIKEATIKGWKDFYPPKEKGKKKQPKQISKGAFQL